MSPLNLLPYAHLLLIPPVVRLMFLRMYLSLPQALTPPPFLYSIPHCLLHPLSPPHYHFHSLSS